MLWPVLSDSSRARRSASGLSMVRATSQSYQREKEPCGRRRFRAGARPALPRTLLAKNSLETSPPPITRDSFGTSFGLLLAQALTLRLAALPDRWGVANNTSRT